MRLKQLLAKFNEGINLGGVIKKLTTQHSQTELLNTSKISINLIAAIIVFMALVKSVEVFAQDSLNILYYPSAKEISYELTGSVDLVINDLRYNYSIKSLPGSQQNINFFRVEILANITQILKPSGWISCHFPISKETVGWYTIDSTMRITPNGTLSGLSYISEGLPVINNSYCRGYVHHPVVSEDPDSIVGANIYENSVIKRTIAPKTIPNPFDPLTFIDSMVEMGNEADTLDWIGKPGQEDQVWFNLKGKLNKVQSYIENENYNLAIDELDSFLTAVEDYYKGKTKNLMNEGYALMKYNGEYLIKHIRTLGK